MAYTLVTGASSGIGRAFVEHYASQKKNVVLVARSEATLTMIKNTIEQQYGITAIILVADLSLPGSGRQIYDKLAEMGITINTLVNAAGIAVNGAVDDAQYEQQHDEIMLNVVSLFDLCKLLLGSMVKRRSGTIINVASTSAYHPIPMMAVYAASKAFVLSFSESLALECADTNVTVFAISPGATDTAFFKTGGVAYGKLRSPDHVVKVTMKAIKKGKISKIDGYNNYLTSMLLPRIMTRKRIARMVYKIMHKQLLT